MMVPKAYGGHALPGRLLFNYCEVISCFINKLFLPLFTPPTCSPPLPFPSKYRAAMPTVQVPSSSVLKLLYCLIETKT